MTIAPSITRSPRTPFNRNPRTERRVLRNGKWVRPDAEAIALRRLIFGVSPDAGSNKSLAAILGV